MTVQRMHELMRKHTKAELLRMAFAGGLVDFNSPAKWTKDEIASVVVDQEEDRKRRAEPEQPAPEDYTHASISGVDLTKPHGYRVCGFYDRGDGIEEVLLNSGYGERVATHITCSLDLARAEVDASRVGHNFYGPTRVYVWERREDEYYALPLPDKHDRYDFAAVPKPADASV